MRSENQEQNIVGFVKCVSCNYIIFVLSNFKAREFVFMLQHLASR